MPYLNIKLAAAPSAELSGRVAAILTDLTVELLKKKREVVAVAIEYADPASWFIGGKTLVEHGKPSAYLDIKVTRATNTKEEKSIYLARIFAALEQTLGQLHPASYAVIHELDADSWGYEGRTQEFRFISARIR